MPPAQRRDMRGANAGSRGPWAAPKIVENALGGALSVRRVGCLRGAGPGSLALEVALVPHLLDVVALDRVDLRVGIDVVGLGRVPPEDAVADRALGVRLAVGRPVLDVRVRTPVVLAVVAVETRVPPVAFEAVREVVELFRLRRELESAERNDLGLRRAVPETVRPPADPAGTDVLDHLAEVVRSIARVAH